MNVSWSEWLVANISKLTFNKTTMTTANCGPLGWGALWMAKGRDGQAVTILFAAFVVYIFDITVYLSWCCPCMMYLNRVPAYLPNYLCCAYSALGRWFKSINIIGIISTCDLVQSLYLWGECIWFLRVVDMSWHRQRHDLWHPFLIKASWNVSNVSGRHVGHVVNALYHLSYWDQQKTCRETTFPAKLEEGSIYRSCGESNSRPFSMTPVRENMHFDVPQWIGRAVRRPEFSGYRMPAANQGIKPWDFGRITGTAPHIPLVRI